jgi:GT2 family glycosyltransferase
VIRGAPVSVIISVLNEGRQLSKTISSLAAAKDWPAEIVIVDDGSTDGCANAIEAKGPVVPRLHVFRRPHEGIAAARHFGALVAKEPLLVFLDAHCAVATDWLEPLIETIRAWPNAIAIPTITSSKRAADRGCGARLVNDLLAYRWITDRPPPTKAGIAPGGCFAIRRDTLLELGGFAAMRDFGTEDVELSLRAWRLGCSILTVPDSCVLHDFRRDAPYVMRSESWLANVLLTALLHFDGERLRQTMRAAGGFASFSPAITSVLSSQWLERKAWIDVRSVRTLQTYWEAFSPKAHDASTDATRSVAGFPIRSRLEDGRLA